MISKRRAFDASDAASLVTRNVLLTSLSEQQPRQTRKHQQPLPLPLEAPPPGPLVDPKATPAYYDLLAKQTSLPAFATQHWDNRQYVQPFPTGFPEPADSESAGPRHSDSLPLSSQNAPKMGGNR